MRMMLMSAKRPSTLSLVCSLQDRTQGGRYVRYSKTHLKEKTVVDVHTKDIHTSTLQASTYTSNTDGRDTRRIHSEDHIDYNIDYVRSTSGTNPTNKTVHQKHLTYEHQKKLLHNQDTSANGQTSTNYMLISNCLTQGDPRLEIGTNHQQLLEERYMLITETIGKIRQELLKAKCVVSQATLLSNEMGKLTEFQIKLQIPACNLRPNRKKCDSVCQTMILVTSRNCSSQIWSLEKLENKVAEIRRMFEDKSNDTTDKKWCPPEIGNPFCESQEDHHLIGVANIFSQCLFHDVALNYHTPIISQQGQVAGQLHIEISKLGDTKLDPRLYLDTSPGSHQSPSLSIKAQLLIRLRIKEARGLPPELSNFVFCQYTYWGESQACIVAALISPQSVTLRSDDDVSFIFNHEKHFPVDVTKEFIKHCSDGALSIEVWGHTSKGFDQDLTFKKTDQDRSRSLTDRWNEVMKKVEFWAEIHELNDRENYRPVEVLPRPGVMSAGVMQLKQGSRRRVFVRIRNVANSGDLPLVCESISALSIGCVCVRSSKSDGLDSYQEQDLTVLRDHWSKMLTRRKTFLDEQIQKLVNKKDKSEAESEQEKALIKQWVSLMEEHNAVLLPSPGSNIPGAPASWCPPSNVEEHSPVIFLDLNADDMTATTCKEGLQAVGIDSILRKEHGTDYINLPIVESYQEQDSVCAVGQWEAYVHDCPHLNRVTGASDLVYMIIKAVVRLSYPAAIEIIMRKRICVSVQKKLTLSGLTSRLRSRVVGRQNTFSASGVIYQVVSNLPKCSKHEEDFETDGQMVGSQNETWKSNEETCIKSYIRSQSEVDSILALDRLRQEVALRETVYTSTNSSTSLRKTTKLPGCDKKIVPEDGAHKMAENYTDQDMHTHNVEPDNDHDREPCKPQQVCRLLLNMSQSSTNDGLSPICGKVTTPSTASSGYVSQPVSALTLSSGDISSEESLNSNAEIDSLLPEFLIADTDVPDMTCINRNLVRTRKHEFCEKVETCDIIAKCADIVSAVIRVEERDVNCESFSEHNDNLNYVMTASEGGVDMLSSQSPAMLASDSSENVIYTVGSGSVTDTSDEDKSEPNEGSISEEGYKEARKDQLAKCSRSVTSESVNSVDTLISENVVSVIDKDDDDDETKYYEKLRRAETKRQFVKKNKVQFSKTDQRQVMCPKASRTDAPMDKKFVTKTSSVLHNDALKDKKCVTKTSSVQHNDAPRNKKCLTKTSSMLHNDALKDKKCVTKTSSMLHNDVPKDKKCVVSTSSLLHKDASNSKRCVTKTSSMLHTDALNDKKYVTKASSVLHIKTNKCTDKSKCIGKSSSVFSLSSSQIKEEKTHTNQESKFQRGVMTVSRSESKLSGFKSRLADADVFPQPELTSCVSREERFRNREETDQRYTESKSMTTKCPSGNGTDVCESDGLLSTRIQNADSVTVISSRGLNKTGTVRFVGTVQFAGGIWFGLELDLAEGKNDGSVNGVRYFQCRPKYGVFVRQNKIVLNKDTQNSSSQETKNLP